MAEPKFSNQPDALDDADQSWQDVAQIRMTHPDIAVAGYASSQAQFDELWAGKGWELAPLPDETPAPAETADADETPAGGQALADSVPSGSASTFEVDNPPPE